MFKYIRIIIESVLLFGNDPHDLEQVINSKKACGCPGPNMATALGSALISGLSLM